MPDSTARTNANFNSLVQLELNNSIINLKLVL